MLVQTADAETGFTHKDFIRGTTLGDKRLAPGKDGRAISRHCQSDLEGRRGKGGSVEALETTVQTKECSTSPSRVFEPELAVREVLSGTDLLYPHHTEAHVASVHME